MSAKSNIALAAAIVLSTASAAMSAPKHPVHPVHHRYHATVAKRHAPPAAYQSFGFIRSSAPRREPEYMRFQDRGIQQDIGG